MWTREDVRSARWWLVAVVAAPIAIGVAGLLGDVSEDVVVAECFQRGFQPPPCSAGGSGSGSAEQTPASAVPDSGINACQNQAAMATSLGLLPAVCPGTARG